MKRQAFLATLMLASGALLMQPALADETHHPDQKSGAAATPAASDQAIRSMQANTRKMQAQLEQMARSKNPQERARLMQEHLKTMQENMAMGQGMTGGQGGMGMMGGQGGMGMMMGQGGMGMMGQGASGQPGMSGQDEMMMKRMEMMEKRMDMMQMMMQKNMGGMPQTGMPSAK